MLKNCIYFILAIACLSIKTNAQQRKFFTKDSVTTIIIRDSAKMAIAAQKIKAEELAKAAQTKIQKPKIDSSRFVKRGQIKSTTTTSVLVPGKIKVDKNKYGTYTEYIADYVEKYHKNHGSHIANIKQRNRAYFAMIENTLKRNGMPKELKSLAIIESAMNPNAVSPVGAAGPWQFMEGTAKLLGLRVDEGLDERRDMYKSTQAAAKYMRQLYGMFHDWLLVIASYNCGPSPVLRAINSGAGRSFWDIKNKLPRETQNHVMAFIATTSYIDRNSDVLSMGNLPRESKAPKPNFAALKKLNPEPVTSKDKNSKKEEADEEDVAETEADDKDKPNIKTEEINSIAILKVKGAYCIQAVAQILDEDAAKLRRWNPTFDETIISSATPIQIRIPINKLEKFIIDKDKIIMLSAKMIAASKATNATSK